MCILSQFLWSKNVQFFVLVPSLFCAVLVLLCSEKFNLRCTRFLCVDLISLRDLFPVYAGVGPVLVFLFPLPVLLDLGSFSSPCGVPAQAKFLFLGLREHSSVSRFYSTARNFFGSAMDLSAGHRQDSIFRVLAALIGLRLEISFGLPVRAAVSIFSLCS
jgi:hypothetical protein